MCICVNPRSTRRGIISERVLNKMPEITAVVTAHDPSDSLYTLTEVYLPGIIPLYRSIIALCSTSTSSKTLVMLRRHGVNVRCEAEMPAGIQNMGLIRRAAVRAGVDAGARTIHLCDFDRLLHWEMAYPDELRSLLQEMPVNDFTVLGRNERAFLTHPACQVETEKLSNYIFELVTGKAWDVAGGSRGLSRRAANLLLNSSEEQHVGVDAEWPILLIANPEISVVYRSCEGLEFETPDRFPDEVATAGGITAWIAQVDQSPEEWTRRLEFAQWTAAAAYRTAARVAGAMGEV